MLQRKAAGGGALSMQELRRREQELASLAAIEGMSKKCPTCGMAISKAEGCNKMTWWVGGWMGVGWGGWGGSEVACGSGCCLCLFSPLCGVNQAHEQPSLHFPNWHFWRL